MFWARRSATATYATKKRDGEREAKDTPPTQEAKKKGTPPFATSEPLIGRARDPRAEACGIAAREVEVEELSLIGHAQGVRRQSTLELAFATPLEPLDSDDDATALLKVEEKAKELLYADLHRRFCPSMLELAQQTAGPEERKVLGLLMASAAGVPEPEESGRTLAEQRSVLQETEAHLMTSWHAWLEEHLGPLSKAEVLLRKEVEARKAKGSMFGSSQARPPSSLQWKMSELQRHPERVPDLLGLLEESKTALEREQAEACKLLYADLHRRFCPSMLELAQQTAGPEERKVLGLLMASAAGVVEPGEGAWTLPAASALPAVVVRGAHGNKAQLVRWLEHALPEQWSALQKTEAHLMTSWHAWLEEHLGPLSKAEVLLRKEVGARKAKGSMFGSSQARPPSSLQWKMSELQRHPERVPDLVGLLEESQTALEREQAEAWKLLYADLHRRFCPSMLELAQQTAGPEERKVLGLLMASAAGVVEPAQGGQTLAEQWSVLQKTEAHLMTSWHAWLEEHLGPLSKAEVLLRKEVEARKTKAGMHSSTARTTGMFGSTAPAIGMFGSSQAIPFGSLQFRISELQQHPEQTPDLVSLLDDSKAALEREQAEAWKLLYADLHRRFCPSMLELAQQTAGPEERKVLGLLMASAAGVVEPAQGGQTLAEQWSVLQKTEAHLMTSWHAWLEEHLGPLSKAEVLLRKEVEARKTKAGMHSSTARTTGMFGSTAPAIGMFGSSQAIPFGSLQFRISELQQHPEQTPDLVSLLDDSKAALEREQAEAWKLLYADLHRRFCPSMLELAQQTAGPEERKVLGLLMASAAGVPEPEESGRTLAEQWSVLQETEAHLMTSWHAWLEEHLGPLSKAEVLLRKEVEARKAKGSMFGSSQARPPSSLQWKMSELQRHPERVPDLVGLLEESKTALEREQAEAWKLLYADLHRRFCPSMLELAQQTAGPEERKVLGLLMASAAGVVEPAQGGQTLAEQWSVLQKTEAHLMTSWHAWLEEHLGPLSKAEVLLRKEVEARKTKAGMHSSTARTTGMFGSTAPAIGMFGSSQAIPFGSLQFRISELQQHPEQTPNLVSLLDDSKAALEREQAEAWKLLYADLHRRFCPSMLELAQQTAGPEERKVLGLLMASAAGVAEPAQGGQTLAEQWSVLQKTEAHLMTSWHAWLEEHLGPLSKAEVLLRKEVGARKAKGSLQCFADCFTVLYHMHDAVLSAAPHAVLHALLNAIWPAELYGLPTSTACRPL